MEKKPSQVFYVNGYGVPRDVLTDANYRHYVQYVISYAETSDAPVLIYFVGGATDPAQPDKTEAGEMERLAETLIRPDRRDRLTLRLITEATDLPGNIRAFAHRLPAGEQVTVFCEYARQDRMRFLVHRMLKGAKVVPVAFDQKMGNGILARLRELPNSFLMIGGLMSPLFKRWVTDPARQRHIRRDSARRHARPSS